MHVFFSPFIVPVAGCLVAIVAIIGGVWSDARKRAYRSQERLAMISRGVPLSEIEGFFKNEDENGTVRRDPLRSLSNTRRAAICLVSTGVGLILFFWALSVIVHNYEVLAGAAVGLIPLAIGVGFFIDYGLQKRDLLRFAFEAGAELK